MAFPSHVGFNFTPTVHMDIYPEIDATKSDLFQPSKVVLITGAGRGIGRSIALETGTELDEVELAINKIDDSVRVHKILLDISNEKQVIAAVETIKKEEGRLDILVNNAGTSGEWIPIAEGETSSWIRNFEISTTGAYLMLHYFLPLLVETAEKEKTTVDVLNTVSIGVHMATPGASHYQVSRLAVLRMCDFVHAEYAAKGINCIALAPGMVLTSMSKDSPVAAYCKDTPEMCGGFVVWLTKTSRPWLGGRYVSVNWDATELDAMKDEIVAGDKLKFRMVF